MDNRKALKQLVCSKPGVLACSVNLLHLWLLALSMMSVNGMSAYSCLILKSKSTIVSEMMQVSLVTVTKSVPFKLKALSTL